MISEILKKFFLEIIWFLKLNLSENNGKFITNRNGIIKEIIAKKSRLANIGNWLKLICGIDDITRAKAGVGSPLKEFICVVSILKFAKRYAEKIGIKSASDAG